MGKIVAAFNTTLDGVFDHTAGVPDAAIHAHYTGLLSQSDVILYGRTTYELMEYWRSVLDNPTGEKAMDAFAQAIDKIHKMVFSRTLALVDWPTATLAQKSLQETVLELKAKSEKDILVGSRSLILQLLELDLLDELQLCIHPVIAGSGATLFEGLGIRKELGLKEMKAFGSGAVLAVYGVRDF